MNGVYIFFLKSLIKPLSMNANENVMVTVVAVLKFFSRNYIFVLAIKIFLKKMIEYLLVGGVMFVVLFAFVG